MGENNKEISEKHMKNILLEEVMIMKNKLIQSIKFLAHNQTIRETEMFGPIIINYLVSLLMLGFKTDQAVPKGYALYVITLILVVACLYFILIFNLVHLSVAQIISILSYSLIYFIPFGIIGRILDTIIGKSITLYVAKASVFLPPTVFQGLISIELSTDMIPQELKIIYAIPHFIMGIALSIFSMFIS